MGKFDRFSYDAGRQGATPTSNTDTSLLQRGRNLLQVIRTPSRRKRLALIVVLALITFPIAGVIIGYVTRPAVGTQASGVGSPAGISSDSPARGTSAKPAAGKPLIPVMQPAPTSGVPQTSAPAVSQNPPALVPPQSQSTAPLGASPLPQIGSAAPPVTANAPYDPVMYPARHDKHFGESCSGQLTLNSNGLMFNCPENPEGSVQVAIAQIASVDENGIRLISGKKYHFSIPGMTKSGEQQLFTDWLNRVR